jgi:tetratricopeptide (TPR) repeat protein
LSDACILLTVRHYGNLSTAQTIARALPAAQRALELAPGLAEAHASFGVIELQRGEFRAAEAAFRRARELNPGYTMAIVWLGLALNAEGRYKDATAVNREAFRLDPLSPIVNSNVAFDALRFGDVEEARRRLATAQEIDPEFLVPYSGMARVHAARGELREALRWIERAIALAPTRSFFHARKGLLLLQLGEMDAAAESIQTACTAGSGDVVEPELAVALYVAQADRDALVRIANGQAGPAFSDDQRAQAFLSLGEFAAAGSLYERTATSPTAEINDILGGDWIWRLPHSINRANLQLRSGDPRGRATLEEYLAGVGQARDAGIVNADLLYRAATALGLLGRQDQALAQLEEAVRLGWRHAWWARADVNLAQIANDPRYQVLLDRAGTLATGTAAQVRSP